MEKFIFFEKYMKLALTLAEKGRGRTSPNPMVGAVIVNKKRIVGQGYHRKAGLAHAEINALKQAKKRAEGATLFVNLEPCCHYGKTPPCTDAIIKSRVKRVVIGMRDPNPLVSGKGIGILKRAGIEIHLGVLEKECRRLNEAYIKFIKKEMPFVSLKVGESLDGKIATIRGDSRWITCKKSRELVHKLRREFDAIMVGSNTVIKDDPMLTARLRGRRGKSPKRIIVDSSLRIPLRAKVLNSNEADTYVFTTRNAPLRKKALLEKRGVKVFEIGRKEGRIDLKRLMIKLGKLNITSLLIEGGGEINASALKERIVDKVIFFVSPVIIGGKEAPCPVSGRGFPYLKEAIKLKNMDIKRIDRDVLIEGYVNSHKG